MYRADLLLEATAVGFRQTPVFIDVVKRSGLDVTRDLATEPLGRSRLIKRDRNPIRGPL